ncbi:SR-related and CTD-associated factor 4-like isoform X2 [Boleophthalmus pectinirostris]|uniref:SR-related and CTD-associated factor 4-like isoform X2 n=1 Tax=Boleophthalmus pectinirostris TaxID=150288 RepID=UPI0024310E51|nr:SR-related and CTD-associated factor 4-like isoform X2 [Boleophthalmus pectinirostris]
MDAVNAFNAELFSMIDMKPPISRAKMMSVTKSAIKAIKLYKHVVQLVEKFVKKCKPELKVPGLYVVDSIVRQSRHQFGVDKDVFGPRFLKNFTETFHNLYSCPEEDKTKILRVLNLWQKNGVFDMDIIQPLMDMAHGPVTPASTEDFPSVNTEPHINAVPAAPAVPAEPAISNMEALAAMAQLFQSPQGQELQRVLQNLQQGNETLAAAIENNLANQAQMSAAHPSAYISHTNNNNTFAELLDRFEYEDEPEEKAAREDHAQLLSIAENVLKQFAGQLPNTQEVQPHLRVPHDGNVLNQEMMHPVPDAYNSVNEPYTREPLRDDSPVRRDGRHRSYGRRSRSRSRSPHRRHSRSSSRSRRSRHRHTRSRSRERHRRSRSMERSERERERERRQRGLPAIKPETLSVCSTTLWVGQLDKKTQQADIMLLLEDFGQIESVNMIPPRGCAYIVMIHRQDANTALNKLSRGSFRVNQKPFKIAWALNKGIKSAHKKFWDVEHGVTYIPWSKVKMEELESYREGGIIDADTVNPAWGLTEEFLNHQRQAGAAVQSSVSEGAASGSVQVPPGQLAAPLASPPAHPVLGLLSPTSVPTETTPVLELSPAANTTAKILKSPDISSTSSSTETPSSSLSADPKPDPNLASPVNPVPPFAMPPGPFPPPGMPPPGMPPFMPPPMGRPPMMPGGPMFPPDRFGMPMPFPPRGPPFPRPGMDMGPFRPGFGPPPFRPRW